MTFTVSAPVRYAALLMVLAGVLAFGAMTMLGRGGGDEQSIASLEAEAARLSHAKAPATKKAPAATKPEAKPAPVAPKPKAAARPSAMVAALNAGLPYSLAKALGEHRVVVVSLYNPYSEVDGISFAEARAGAKLAGTGFVALNVLSQAQVGKLTEQLGLLPNPGVLVYTRPSALVARISGFADKETVAQAAHNAAGAP